MDEICYVTDDDDLMSEDIEPLLKRSVALNDFEKIVNTIMWSMGYFELNLCLLQMLIKLGKYDVENGTNYYINFKLGDVCKIYVKLGRKPWYTGFKRLCDEFYNRVINGDEINDDLIDSIF